MDTLADARLQWLSLDLQKLVMTHDSVFSLEHFTNVKNVEATFFGESQSIIDDLE
jgi:hypothetical protein